MQSKFTSTVFAFICGALVVAIAFGVGLSVASMQSASAANAQQWEYKTLVLMDFFGPFGDANEALYGSRVDFAEDAAIAVVTKLNELGAQGWELVSVSYDQGDECVLVFKRLVG